MARKNKLQRFADSLQMPNFFQTFDALSDELQHVDYGQKCMVGHWHTYFDNDHPICLELACGKGEYTIELSTRYPNRNYIGVDIKGARLWKGAAKALRLGLDNVAFLRIRIEQIARHFKPGELDEIWITFPDPFLKKESRRLTAPRFLDSYRQILKPKSSIHLKTDDPTLYQSTLDVLSTYPHTRLLTAQKDIYSGELAHPDLDIITYYERQHLKAGRLIKYIRFAIT